MARRRRRRQNKDPLVALIIFGINAAVVIAKIAAFTLVLVMLVAMDALAVFTARLGGVKRQWRLSRSYGYWLRRRGGVIRLLGPPALRVQAYRETLALTPGAFEDARAWLATINTAADEGNAVLSKDGLSLYFHSTRPGGSGNRDIWVSQRASVDDAWGTPVNLGPTVNTASNDFPQALSPDGHWLFLISDRPGGFGSADIYASWRQDIHDDLGWQAPVNLGLNVNSSGSENAAWYFPNDERGAPQLFVGSSRPGGLGGMDLYVNSLQPDGTWGPATPISELNTTSSETHPSLNHNGLEIFFYSNRPGGLGGFDLWTATRETVDAPWASPVNLGAPVNSSSLDFGPDLAWDRETLFFDSLRPGGFGGDDLWVTTRSKSHGHG
jgi:hypothetical protein